ncbi:ImmA/IrrE family metallo-endopeptidase [Lactobacillus sp. S2-2]|uniref:ImmA/IrrE family metallo-endopeptidase n=1 Tax=Lactobacillus sp. S2-2 TaxID=2692917 RepID=UPI001F36EAD7|nr:ImmA/IrrE family metallo-endopeptidase [Lactobacillus sp. S2-2]MCF6515498.1 ImmA/IrrE family metallo-endopeptidase [Lactobacillus sp. S2-2]
MNNKINEAIKTVIDRYKTADPFAIAEKMTIDVQWSDLMPNKPLGQNMYDSSSNIEPIIILNSKIKNSPMRNLVMAHELGHVIVQNDLIGCYTSARNGHNSFEREATDFAVGLLSMLYVR